MGGVDDKVRGHAEMEALELGNCLDVRAEGRGNWKSLGVLELG